MYYRRWVLIATSLLAAARSFVIGIRNPALSLRVEPEHEQLLQNLVWLPLRKRTPLTLCRSADEDSLLVNGERIFLYSGEFHPFRSVSNPPVDPSLTSAAFRFLHYGLTSSKRSKPSVSIPSPFTQIGPFSKASLVNTEQKESLTSSHS